MHNVVHSQASKDILVTGGAGFVGCNVADYYAQHGHRVTILDSLARRGSEHNLQWLQERHGSRLTFIRGDVRDATVIDDLAASADVVFHLAAQVAVTTSVLNPRADFEINALGTLNVLEGARLSPRQPIVVYTSTNKVYGRMDDLAVVEGSTRYSFRDLPYGVDESRPLDFHSPYGCSKGASDQYVLDYARIYGLRTIVFRMSCIYGCRQFGNEDQGWVAHFVIAAITDQPITIYGDGKQVRDVLWVADLVDAFDKAVASIETTRGKVYNIGGGSLNTLSIWVEFRDLLSPILGCRLDPAAYGACRQGDQPVYISDIRRAEHDFGWRPTVAPSEGIARLATWASENRHLVQ